ncbi:MAG TPA: hypothetical protein VMH81_18050 [Bryobacteraceae bacterium]|nr:hypothetical protein [Bryobacteraceae bacterium]
MRYCLWLFFVAVASLIAAEPSVSVRGKLSVHEGAPATIETADHQTVTLDGDTVTRKVLDDQRLSGFEVEARGHFTTPGHFQIDPTHTHSLLVRQNGKLKLVSYWCDVCSIRAYTPGPCVCCQRETHLDLIDPDQQ